MRSARCVALLVLLVCTALAAPRAAAQSARDEARTRFERGVELFDEGQYDQALVEFRRAYDLAPAAAVLFNVARVHAALGHAVEAVDTYARYLREAERVAPERRREVEQEVQRLEARIARLTIRVDAPDAIVRVDDVVVDATQPVRVTVGSHLVAATAPGRDPARERVEVAGGDARTVELRLAVSGGGGGSLRIDSRVPGVTVRVDDREVGVTPLDATVRVAAGAHRVVAARAGYHTTERAVIVEPGTEASVALELSIDADADAASRGELTLALPDAAYSVAVDGAALPGEPSRLTLPVGPHDLVLDVAGRERLRQRVELSAAGIELRPALVWTPDARAARLGAAGEQRTAGWVLLVSGAALAVAGAAVLAWNEESFASSGVREQRDVLLPQCEAWARGAPSSTCDMRFGALGLMTALGRRFDSWNAVSSRVDARIGECDLARVLGGVAAGVGAAALLVGVILVVAAPSDEAIDRSASAARAPRVSLGLAASQLTLRMEL